VIHYSGDSSQVLLDATTTGTGNYVLFTGLTSSTCVISGQAFQYPGTGNGTRGCINGVQIVDATQTVPALANVTPAAGSVLGGNRVSVFGANLLPGATFKFGSTAAVSPQYLSDTAYALTVPAGSGTVALTYTGFNGTVTLPNAYTYGSTGSSLGDAISYNFNHNDQNGGVNPLGPTESAGVVARLNWNNSTSNVNAATDSSLMDNLGGNTGARFGWSLQPALDQQRSP